MTAHLRPTAPIAADVLLPADPALAMALAQRLLDKPRMANHNHGLWGYSGRDAEGRELTVQATGIGGPTAAVVVAELADHGARRAIRLGLCRALDPALTPGDAVIADGCSPGRRPAVRWASTRRPTRRSPMRLHEPPARAQCR